MMYHSLQKIGLHHCLRRLTKQNKITILSLHRISDKRNFFWDPLSPKRFAELCSYLSKNYRVVTFNELAESITSDKPLVILSFDDGYYDFMEFALDILNKFKFPANQNIVVECAEKNMIIWTQRMNYIFEYLRNNSLNDFKLLGINKEFELKQYQNSWMKFYNGFYQHMMTLSSNERDEILHHFENILGTKCNDRMMNWDDLRTVANCDIELGNHSYSHPVVSTISSQQELHKEIVLSKKILENKLKTNINIFSYPNGKMLANGFSFFTNNGYKFLLEMNEKINSLSKLKDKLPVIFNRLNIVNEPIQKLLLRVELLHSTIKRITL